LLGFSDYRKRSVDFSQAHQAREGHTPGKKTVSRRDHRCERLAQEAVSGVTFDARFLRLATPSTLT
jgi:hypothetical protein